MRASKRLDLVVAIGLLLAAAVEATLRDRGTPALLAFELVGSLGLLSLAVRRSRPLVPLAVVAAAGVVGTTVTRWAWPDADADAGVWIFALMLASYSVGAHGSRRDAALGVLLPLVVVVSADVSTRSGWERVSGIVFVTVFVGLLPTVAGRVMAARTARLQVLGEQRYRILRAQAARREAAVLAERLRIADRLQPTLTAGLASLARAAESPGDPRADEEQARDLLGRTREEVVALAAPVPPRPPAGPELPLVAPLAALRGAAQPWSVVVAGAVAAGLCLESVEALAPTAPWWQAVGTGIAMGTSLALLWRRPVLAAALAWTTATAFSRTVAPLDGSLSVAALTFATPFAVAALSRRWAALAGLGVCLVGGLVGVGASDPVGVGLLSAVCWLAGRGLHELSRLVEQGRANNALLAREEATRGERAVLEERLRMAREIHDAVGHSLTVVALQAGAARRLAGTDPPRPCAVLHTVPVVAHVALAAVSAEEGPGDLGRLVERVRAAGLDVEADLAGESALLPEQRAVAFRVVQEALTNVLRHAPGSRAGVLIGPRAAGVEVVVANTAPLTPGPGPGSGRGLAGLEERVTAVSGALSWGRRPDGGFEVRALLPGPVLAEAARA
ncbi:MAG: sensor histidine kinase [Nocardioides sp.]